MPVDLTTRYLGMLLKHPIGMAACAPLTGDLPMLQRLEEAGASFAVMPSLFEEQIEHEELEVARMYDFQSESFAEALTHFPETVELRSTTEKYLEHIQAAKDALKMPIIGSLNGASPGGWVRYAKAIEEAGADALELNIYIVPTDLHCSAAEVEQRYVDLVARVRESVSIPLAIKIGQNFTSLPDFARQLVAAGADGLVLFNRYLEADIDLDSLQFKPDLVLSSPHEARVPIRWIAILRDQLEASFAATSGIHCLEGAVKLLLAGADATMVASVVLMHGPSVLETLIDGLRTWLQEKEYDSVEQLKGSMSRGNCPDPGLLERANYMKALTTYTKAPTAI